jgi:DNA-binding beta-propeller fold protein YncE
MVPLDCKISEKNDMRAWFLGFAAAGLFCAADDGALAQPACSLAAAKPQEISQDVSLSGHPFSAVPASDGCHVFVSLTGASSKLVVLAVDKGALSVAHSFSVQGQLTGLALSPDGRFLIGANGSGATLFDVSRILAGADKPEIGYLNDPKGAGSIYAAFSRDGHLLFVANERSASITVHDFAGLIAGQPDHAGHIETGGAPVGLAVSPDGKYLYSTSEVERGGGQECAAEGGNGPRHAPGRLMVIDIAAAERDPSTAVVRDVAAGCNAVRVVLSADGARAFVTARGENALLAFDTAKLLAKAGDALTMKVKTGSSPVGVLAAGGHVFVTNSDRFGGGAHQTVQVFDEKTLTPAGPAIAAGGFPRELSLMPDGKTLLITNFATQTVEAVDLASLP